jgi:hypothetical protein
MAQRVAHGLEVVDEGLGTVTRRTCCVSEIGSTFAGRIDTGRAGICGSGPELTSGTMRATER